MGEYVTRTHRAEATQWFKDGDHPAVVYDCLGAYALKEGDRWIRVRPGDWIVETRPGRHKVMGPRSFASRYEPASAAGDASTEPLPWRPGRPRAAGDYRIRARDDPGRVWLATLTEYNLSYRNPWFDDKEFSGPLPPSAEDPGVLS